jgi:hypothetical protein
MRRAALAGKEVTVPPGVPIKPGEIVVAYYAGFVLYVPIGSIVDEGLLVTAIKIKAK